MANGFGQVSDNEQIELPPGFRYHPTDEELIIHYLQPKVINGNFSCIAIGDVDLNKVEPWELPWRAKMGEKEWYFFCVRDRKYPTGLRTNRATDAGYWKATGKDKEILKRKSLIGMKKTLVFYKGRAPKGEKTNWVMHEYRLEGNSSINNISNNTKGEWVISRVFQKTSGGKKIPISGLMRMRNNGDEFGKINLPPLMEFSPNNGQTGTEDTKPEASHVTCFSGSMESHKHQEDHVVESFNNSSSLMPTINNKPFNDISSAPNQFYSNQFIPNVGDNQFQDPFWMPPQPNLGFMVGANEPNMTTYPANEPNMTTYPRTDVSHNTDLCSGISNLEMGQNAFDDQGYPYDLGGPVNLDCLWNF